MWRIVKYSWEDYKKNRKFHTTKRAQHFETRKTGLERCQGVYRETFSQLYVKQTETENLEWPKDAEGRDVGQPWNFLTAL
jgi:hypothetical protein